jgi:hypothetical protein
MKLLFRFVSQKKIPFRTALIRGPMTLRQAYDAKNKMQQSSILRLDEHKTAAFYLPPFFLLKNWL